MRCIFIAVYNLIGSTNYFDRRHSCLTIGNISLSSRKGKRTKQKSGDKNTRRTNSEALKMITDALGIREHGQ